MKSWAEADQIWTEHRFRLLSNRIKLENHTYLHRCEGVDGIEYGVKLHSTIVVTYFQDGRVMLRSGGWQTHTTKARMNTYAPCQVYTNRQVWYVSVGKAEYTYAEGFTFGPAGVDGASDPSQALKLIERHACNLVSARALAPDQVKQLKNLLTRAIERYNQAMQSPIRKIS